MKRGGSELVAGLFGLILPRGKMKDTGQGVSLHGPMEPGSTTFVEGPEGPGAIHAPELPPGAPPVPGARGKGARLVRQPDGSVVREE